MLLRICCAAALTLLISVSAGAATRCEQILKKIGKDLAPDVPGTTITCFESTDLTTNNPLTTPAIDHHARAYARRVEAAREDDGHGHDNDDKKRPAYRLYEVQNGNHIETYQDTFPQLELIQPHAQRAFDLLVLHVEKNAKLPPDQCIPRGGVIAAAPTQAGHCAVLLAP